MKGAIIFDAEPTSPAQNKNVKDPLKRAGELAYR